MKKTITTVVLAVMMTSTVAWAQRATPLGLWRSIDDKTGKPTALVRVTDVAGRLEGQIVKIFPEPGESAYPLCEECEGDLKNQPVVGMIILKDLRRDGDEYTGGQILDPDSGKLYRCTLRLLDGGNRLIIRGYYGIPLLGRSQEWLRE